MSIPNNEQHDEVMALLPWFVNMTLDEKQQLLVTDHLKQCDECQSEVVFLKTVNSATRSGAQSSYNQHANVDKDLNNVMSRLEDSETKVHSSQGGIAFLTSQVKKLYDFLMVIPSGLRNGAAIAGLLVAVLGVQLYQDQAGDNYSVLSSSDTSHNSMRLSVQTSALVNHADTQLVIRESIERYGSLTTIKHHSDGTYLVIVKDDIDVNELIDIVTELENNDSITRVEVLP